MIDSCYTGRKSPRLAYSLIQNNNKESPRNLKKPMATDRCLKTVYPSKKSEQQLQ